MQAWTTGYVLPKQLVDILYSTVEDTEDSEGEDDSDVDDNDSGDKKIKYSWGLITERVYGEPCQLPDCTLSV